MSIAGDAEEPLHTVLSVLRGAASWLEQRRVDAPQRSAELLLGKVLGMSRLELYLAHDRPLAEPERAVMRDLLRRRGAGEPVAYLLGTWSFRGLELAVSPAVLVPRPETEELVSLALEHCAAGSRVVDLGTGSGAIALALAHERPDLVVTATDVSDNALQIARQNAARHGLAERVAFFRGSWWSALPAAAAFDVVVSNPPYVEPTSAVLEPGVRAFEPPLALFAKASDPASCYREIAAGLAGHLAAGGTFVAETGAEAAEPALQLLRSTPGLVDAVLLPDSAGLPRFLLARRA